MHHSNPAFFGIVAVNCSENYSKEEVIVATAEELVGLNGQMHRILTGVADGELDSSQVAGALKLIIGKAFALVGGQPTRLWRPPSWWRTPEQQLETARRHWRNAVLPEPPKGFAPHTDTEVLLLHVPDDLNGLWRRTPRIGRHHSNQRSRSIRQGPNTLRRSPRGIEYSGPAWVAFDPVYGQGARVDHLWDGQVALAGPEVISAIIQSPEWPLTWSDGAPAPTLAGYQLRQGKDWTYTLYIGLEEIGLDYVLDLDFTPVDDRGRDNWAAAA